MATAVQLEEGNGLLPPLRELFLEIQVNKLINDYLFSSNADGRCTSLHDGSSEYKENQACFMPQDQLHAEDANLSSGCNAPCVKSAKVLDDHQMQCLQDSQSMNKSIRTENQLHMHTQESFTLHSISWSENKSVNQKEQLVPSNLQALNGGHEASSIPLSMDNDSRNVRKTAHLCRVDTFPCTISKAQLQVGASKVDTEVKASCKKPPRPPPRLPKSELDHPILARCSSDSGQCFRRAKSERKRKASASASANASTWALLFTFCFATIMIAQGFWSQGNQIFGSNASSPVETFTKASMKISADKVRLAGEEDRQASMDSILAQSYVMRKVHLQYLSDMEHLKHDAFPKS